MAAAGGRVLVIVTALLVFAAQGVEFSADAHAWASSRARLLIDRGADESLHRSSHVVSMQVLMATFLEEVNSIPRTAAAFEVVSGSAGISRAVRELGHVSYGFERNDVCWQNASGP